MYCRFKGVNCFGSSISDGKFDMINFKNIWLTFMGGSEKSFALDFMEKQAVCKVMENQQSEKRQRLE